MNEIECYGCTVEEMKKQTESALRIYRDGAFYAMAIMSDAQEELVMGQIESARQTINKAKWVLANYALETA